MGVGEPGEDGIVWLPPRPARVEGRGESRRTAGPKPAEWDWHRRLATRSRARRKRPRTWHLIGLNVCAAGLFGYLRYLALASRGSPVAVGLAILASLILVVAMIAGAIVLGRASSSYLRRAEGRAGRSGQALELASLLAAIGSVVLLALLILSGIGFVIVIVNGLASGE